MSLTATYTHVANDSSNEKKPKRRRSRILVLRTPSLELASAKGDENHTSCTQQPRPSYKSVPSATATCVEHFKVEEALSGDNNTSVGVCSYLQLLIRYPMYRAYFVSHLCQNLGDWFVRIASILVVEEFSSSGKTIAHLSLSVLLPKAIFSQVGGVIADRLDRRVCMICLDLLSGVVVLGYLVAIQYKSLNLMYAVTILRSTLGATYYPVTTGMVPLLVPDPHDLQLAVTLNSFAWSVSSIIGGLVAGGLMSQIGFQTCYYIDSVTFFVSAAWIYWGIRGSFTVHKSHQTGSAVDLEQGENELTCTDTSTSICAAVLETFTTVAKYLSACGFGLLVFQKGSASFIWGIEDVVGAQFGTVFREDGSEDESLSSWHMGMLFSITGLACMVGPFSMTASGAVDARFPHTLQRACWIGYCFLSVGWLLISSATNFPSFLVFSFIRILGSGIAWVYSTLLLQTLCEPSVLGRVLAVEYTLMTLLEASSSMTSGWLEDALGFSKNELALFGAGLGIFMVIFWGIYYFVLGAGAASPRFRPVETTTKEDAGEEKHSHIDGVMHGEAELPEVA